MNRRDFIKIIGLTAIAPKVAVEILNQGTVTPIITKGTLSKTVDINSITSKVWAKQWWLHRNLSLGKYSNRKFVFNDKDYGVISIPYMKNR